MSTCEEFRSTIFIPGTAISATPSTIQPNKRLKSTVEGSGRTNVFNLVGFTLDYFSMRACILLDMARAKKISCNDQICRIYDILIGRAAYRSKLFGGTM